MKPTFAFHFQGWKRPIFERYFPDRKFTFVPMYVSEHAFRKIWMPLIRAEETPEIFVWNLGLPEGLRAFARENGIPLFLVEDGFLRSLEPNATRTPPLSLTLDSGALYFDSRNPSDMEVLLSSYDFEGDPGLMERARNGIRLLLDTGISKYNTDGRSDVHALYGEKRGKRVLVVGQVEDDASIKLGCDQPFTNNDLVRLAAQENPGAQIIYKPHPDVLNGVRLAQSRPADVAHLCTIIDAPLTMAKAFESVDHVYTITSLAGFEAVLRGLKVTVRGAPFYAGWGLTDDRQPTPRRARKLSVEALFAAAYLLYPRYFDPATGAARSFEETVHAIHARLAKPREPSRKSAGKVAWQPIGPYGILGWRHLLTPFIAPIVASIGHPIDAETFRQNPIEFFRELPQRKYRLIGRIIYPFGA
ncbi:capsular polysaccharide biosynthesis protein [Pararhizobium arenae]|uniref:capsular polysaccharide export protein, LipB/KpsS family n=1 Tax=Pararhizobium arenae TaxID=1856850 RepID=UPI001FD96F4D|nr:capsular polysaccharide biosynthesis protein [Pararhizobium arenae]